MGIFNRQMSGITPRVAAVNASVDSSDGRDEGPSKAVIRVESREKEKGETSRSIFEHHFKLVAEGYLSRVFLLDGSHPGMLTRNEDTGIREFVIRDGLSFMAIDDVMALFGKDAKLYIH
ncbi:hypothetical protein Poli38472_009265 [Pythium oligandrum]|uniref:Uncharacterized protein n=1 Tax=Pythium oligandrum TaxID=41045 RepID=A0A8K1FNY6_PYTOL|nr:hypothetical protein Poli38472_009265 [Pythium oligandrum]|eukprot:TMW65098.1 hypothetical protein Poli38472_009265 [Pythium oligandrum]